MRIHGRPDARSREMKTRTARMMVVAAVLLAAVAFGASATALTGWNVDLGRFAKEYAQARGVDLQYVNMAKDQVPEDQWNKITALTQDAKFVSLVQTNLQNTINTSSVTAYTQFGGKTYIVTSYLQGGFSGLLYSFSIK
jgi:hypothetical protein